MPHFSFFISRPHPVSWLINTDASRNCVWLRSYVLVFSGCIPCTYMLLFFPWGCKIPLWVPIRAAWTVGVHFLLYQYRLPRGQDPTLHRRSLCLRVICRCDTVRAEEPGLAAVTTKYTWPVLVVLPEETGLACLGSGFWRWKGLTHHLSPPFHCQLWLRRLAWLGWLG